MHGIVLLLLGLAICLVPQILVAMVTMVLMVSGGAMLYLAWRLRRAWQATRPIRLHVR